MENTFKWLLESYFVFCRSIGATRDAMCAEALSERREQIKAGKSGYVFVPFFFLLELFHLFLTHLISIDIFVIDCCWLDMELSLPTQMVRVLPVCLWVASILTFMKHANDFLAVRITDISGFWEIDNWVCYNKKKTMICLVHLSVCFSSLNWTIWIRGEIVACLLILLCLLQEEKGTDKKPQKQQKHTDCEKIINAKTKRKYEQEQFYTHCKTKTSNIYTHTIRKMRVCQKLSGLIYHLDCTR